MSLIFYGYNLTKNATITATNENAEFPISNIKDDRRTKVFRSTTNDDSVVFDFGSLVPIDSFVIVPHTLNGFLVSGITVQFNNSTNWTSPAFSQVVSLDYENGFGFVELPSVTSYRYARILMTSSLGFCELGKVYFGQKLKEEEFDFAYPLDFDPNNISIVQKNRLGQKFIDEIGEQRIISGKVDYLSPAIYEVAQNFCSYHSKTIPFFVRFDSTTLSTNINRLNGMFYFKDDPKFQYVVGNYWTTSLTLEEAN